jgi:hypothetical protein
VSSRTGTWPRTTRCRHIGTPIGARFVDCRDCQFRAGAKEHAMEVAHARCADGVYWKPVWHVLEGTCELILANAAHLRAIPGGKSDTNDARWLADLLAHGLIRTSFVPPTPDSGPPRPDPHSEAVGADGPAAYSANPEDARGREHQGERVAARTAGLGPDREPAIYGASCRSALKRALPDVPGAVARFPGSTSGLRIASYALPATRI